MERTGHRFGSGRSGGDPLDPDDITHPEGAPEAHRALEAVAAQLRGRGDRRAAFPGVYAIITRRVAENVARDSGAFLEPRWVSRLSGRFCERYLTTLRWSLAEQPQDTGAWSAAYASAALGGSLPVQDVLLGLSAHINFDLAIGIYQTIVEFDRADDPDAIARYEHDHYAVNEMLRASIPAALDHLVGWHACAMSDLLHRRAFALTEWTAMTMLVRWRARVWRDAMEMLAAPDEAGRERVLARMERRSAHIGRLLALRGAAPPRAASFAALGPPGRPPAPVVRTWPGAPPA